MTDSFEIGQLYRAISETDLIEVEPPPPVAGLRLLVHPDGVKSLRAIQKDLRKSLGYKPSFPQILNAMLSAVPWDSHIEAITAQIIAQPQSSPDEQ